MSGKALAEHCNLHLLVQVPIIGRCGLPFEHQAPGRPDIDEVGGSAEPALIDDVRAREEHRGKEHDVQHSQRKADLHRQFGNAAA